MEKSLAEHNATDNTEVVEKLAWIIANISWHDNASKAAARTILAAIQADPLEFVKPKPLEWVEENDRWVATIFDVDQYIIGYDTRSIVGEYSLFIRGEWTPYHTLEAAQAAAYEDLCNRVKELF